MLWWVSFIIFLVDGKYGSWSDWTSCTKTCGGGAQRRTRECNNPAPSGGGKDCVGPNVETQGCANDFCKGMVKLAWHIYHIEKSHWRCHM